ncbi:MAG: hypothetical protein U1A78_08560 [Polyangia bacterium]
MQLPSALIELAHRLTPPEAGDAELHAAWQLLLRAIEHLPFDQPDLRELLSDLQQGRDHVLEELGFDFLDGRLRVSFLDERVYCAPGPLIHKLEQVAAAYRGQKK